MIPPSPWIGSTRNAAVCGVIAASSAALSPNGIDLNPGANGPKPSPYCGSEENPTMVIERPWKLFSQTMISARPSGMPLTR